MSTWLFCPFYSEFVGRIDVCPCQLMVFTFFIFPKGKSFCIQWQNDTENALPIFIEGEGINWRGKQEWVCKLIADCKIKRDSSKYLYYLETQTLNHTDSKNWKSGIYVLNKRLICEQSILQVCRTDTFERRCICSQHSWIYNIIFNNTLNFIRLYLQKLSCYFWQKTAM